MNLQLSEEQQLLRDMLEKAFARQCTLAHLRNSEALGHDAETWVLFNEFGLPLLRVPEAQGGVGAGLVEAVVVAEALGKFAPVIPGVEMMVAARLLALLGADDVLQDVADGGIALFALDDAAVRRQQVIAHASSADLILFRLGEEIRILSGPVAGESTDIGGLGARLVDFDGDGGRLVAQGRDAVQAYEAAVEEWRLLNAARIAAAAQKSLFDAAEYAKERHAFGRPIGSFQGLAHPMADRLVDVEGASLLILRAIEAISQNADNAAGLVSLASWWAGQAARPATVLGMRVLGGYGVTMEYSAQTYFRRVAAWSLLAGDPDEELQRAASRMWFGGKAHLPDSGENDIRFDFPEHALSLAEEVRAVFAEHATPEKRDWSFGSDDGHDVDLFKKLGAKGLLFPDWPMEYGGRSADVLAVAAVRGVYVEFGWNDTVVAVTELVGRALIDHGSDKAKREIVPRMARGELYGSLGYSEPSCGSDLFAVQTRATRDGEGWVINGQKMFTSQGHLANYSLMVTRTGEDKHKGITLFAAPLDQPGYRCDPIETVGGERTNTTFYDDLRVPDELRIGEVDGGVKVLAAALAREQGSMELFIGSLQEMVKSGVEWSHGSDQNGVKRSASHRVRSVLASVAARLEVLHALHRRALWAASTGDQKKHFGPSGKLFGSEAMIECGEMLMALTAPDSLFSGNTVLGKIEREYRRSIAATIYMGSSEVQRSIIAETGLGLPRTRN